MRTRAIILKGGIFFLLILTVHISSAQDERDQQSWQLMNEMSRSDRFKSDFEGSVTKEDAVNYEHIPADKDEYSFFYEGAYEYKKEPEVKIEKPKKGEFRIRAESNTPNRGKEEYDLSGASVSAEEAPGRRAGSEPTRGTSSSGGDSSTPPPGVPGNGGDPPDTPLDGKIVCLILAALLFGGLTLRERRNEA